MKKHYKVHSEDKILECCVCSKVYDDQDHLDEHEDSRINESRYTCMVKLNNNQICGKKYRIKGSIRYHLKNAHKKQLDMMYYTKDLNVTYETYEQFKFCTSKADDFSRSFDVENVETCSFF